MTRIFKTRTKIAILFIQAGIFFLHARCAWSSLSNQAEKLILGFEESELSQGAYISRQEKPGRESWFYLLAQPEGFDFAARFKWPGETNRTWTWHCRSGAHTEGELALVATVAPVNSEKQTATYHRTEFLSYFYPNIRRGFIEARLLMTTFQFVAYSARDKTDPEAKDEAKAVFTDDGGLSWKQLTDPTARNLDHGTARGCAIDVTGDGIAISSGPGCAGLGNANPRQHLTKYTLGPRFAGTPGKGWEARFPTILDSDIRHCGSNVSVVRLRSGLFKGRLWASWGEVGREHAIGVHAKYSDDDGRTWIPWGKGAGLPGSQSADWSDGTYGYPETVVTPYKEHVACFWRHKPQGGVRWSVYDGSDWSAPAEVSLVRLDDMDGAYRATMSAITKGEREIFFTATGLDTVLRWDGKSWHAEPVRIEDGGMLSSAGDIVTLFTSGKVNRR